MEKVLNIREAEELATEYEQIVEGRLFWGKDALTQRTGFSHSDRCSLCGAIGFHGYEGKPKCENCVWQFGGEKVGEFACVNDNFRDLCSCTDEDDFYLLLAARVKKLRAAIAAAKKERIVV